MSTPLYDDSLLDLFRIELETHSRVLESGLVGAESSPSPSRFEPLMRAAHSIKGAARIVGLADAVGMAHAMEDVLSAAQHERLRLQAGHVDILLQANDIFKAFAGMGVAAIPEAMRARRESMDALAGQLREILLEPSAPDPGPASPPPAPPVPAPAAPAPAAPEAAVPTPPSRQAPSAEPSPPAAADAEEERVEPGFVRVQSENLSRLMGLSGECLVHARALKAFSAGIRKIKVLTGQLEDWVAGRLTVSPGASPAGAPDPVAEAGERFTPLRESVLAHIEDFDPFSRRMENLAERLYAEVIRCRMRPFSEGLIGFDRMVRDLARSLGKRIRFQTGGLGTPVDRDIMERLEAPLTHLLRNAADHGLETPDARKRAGKPEEGTIRVEARHRSGLLEITISDDGKGIDPETVRAKVVEKGYTTGEMAAGMSEAELLEFLFLPGFTTSGNVTELSGRGVGLDVVHTMVHEVRGMVRIESKPGEGTTFRLMLPLALSVMRALQVEIGGEPYAVPLVRIDRLLNVAAEELRVVEDRLYCDDSGETLGLVDARQILQLPLPENRDVPVLRVVVLSDRLSRYGVAVDRFLGERELVVIPLDPRLGKVPNISAGAVMEDGSPLLILDVDDVVRGVDNLIGQGRVIRAVSRRVQRPEDRKRILVVDDSLTVREVERKLLENRGYEVAVAVDGMDGLNALQEAAYHLVVTDVDMPRMDGIELVRRIKADPRRKTMPVMIVSYKDREEDKLRGLEAGADYYLTKSSFHDDRLIGAVRDLIGDP